MIFDITKFFETLPNAKINERTNPIGREINSKNNVSSKAEKT